MPSVKTTPASLRLSPLLSLSQALWLFRPALAAESGTESLPVSEPARAGLSI